jgi:hypothetical protein
VGVGNGNGNGVKEGALELFVTGENVGAAVVVILHEVKSFVTADCFGEANVAIFDRDAVGVEAAGLFMGDEIGEYWGDWNDDFEGEVTVEGAGCSEELGNILFLVVGCNSCHVLFHGSDTIDEPIEL